MGERNSMGSGWWGATNRAKMEDGTASIKEARVEATESLTEEPFKYQEAEILREVYDYIKGTYGQHYVGKNNIQANDLVLAGDLNEARGFWKWNATKYLLRYGKKKGRNRADLMKAVHYAILLLYLDTLQNGEDE